MSGNFRDRRNWTRSLTIASLVAVLAAVIGCLADRDTTSTDRRYLQATAGPVLFDHFRHGADINDCAKCHHDLYGAAQAVSCQECHDVDVTPDDVDHASLKEIHNSDCATCHAQVKENDQAASCRQCHPAVQASETTVISCSKCHDDGYTPELMPHDEYMEAGEHTCLGCHAPSSVSQAFHTNCTTCHLEAAPARFADANGAVVCGACHLR